jgi:hypothetical protein
VNISSELTITWLSDALFQQWRRQGVGRDGDLDLLVTNSPVTTHLPARFMMQVPTHRRRTSRMRD